MKTTLIIIGTLLVIGLFMCNQFSKTTWGGWKPPNTELKLSDIEQNWKHHIEKKYKCNFTFIGLDDAYMEDSIIYMNLNCKNHSDLQFVLSDSLKEITQNLSKSFFQICKKRKNQNCIQINYGKIYYNEGQEKLKYPITKKFLYNSNTNETIIIK